MERGGGEVIKPKTATTLLFMNFVTYHKVYLQLFQ